MESRRLPLSQCFGALSHRVGCREKFFNDGFVRVEVEGAASGDGVFRQGRQTGRQSNRNRLRPLLPPFSNIQSE
jgi:hypothetical protein